MERPFSESAKVVKGIVWKVVGPDMPVGTWFQRTQGSEGEDAIRIVVVFPKSRAAEVTGKQLIAISGDIRDALPGIGEDRTPIVSFAHIEDEPELERARFSAPA
ncbi:MULTISPECIES: hypothetical protein [unclassified Methylobacterium]|uniref:hypothetical protein n=1 Tax=unclassified Methylobacterium TaxID=2615210 RepID=UPI00226A99AC|nr:MULTISPECIES: hypothetical protein [unclassified Methylobacterium]